MGFQVDMSPLERSSRYIGQSLANAGQSIGGALIDRESRMTQAQQGQDNEEQVQDLVQRSMNGDPQALQELMSKSPQAARMVAEQLQGQQATQKQDEIDFNSERSIKTAKFVEQMYRAPKEQQAEMFELGLGDDSIDLDEGDRILSQDKKAQEDLITRAALETMEPKAAEIYLDRFFGEDQDAKKFSQGTGKMSGYSFDTSTGGYSINPELKAKLDEVTDTKVLTLKDKITLNKELTNLTKSTQGIYSAAASLSKLKDTSTATDKLAAIFKFMKSLDPTSVVREGEQDMAVRTGGAADTMVGYVNSLIGDGKLSDKAFTNMVNTAKNLANSAIESSNPEVTNYLSVFGDDLPKNFKASLLNRIPKAFNIKQLEGDKKTIDVDLSKLSLEELKALRAKG
ncbi:MAG: hypothetical protein Unbinned5350contig1004_3 [Prokaryotic dsDNA virus sp.]|nr:MAG: hypothetical protein Unbinned5350contig1004_3 [Prokaryotic dsDNA virus sp.]|tara:strand:+ start:19018 stop:20211 length:1194 start_codon:yes stop_codon:yes gene_type:complete